ncbi:MAG: hypothetical protein ABSD52_08100 [Candidatus Cybelea sp.]
MKTLSLARYAAGLSTASLLAACSGGGSSSLAPTAGSLTPLSSQGSIALTMPHYVERPVHPDRGRSWLKPLPDAHSALLYVSDQDTNDVYVYHYPSGTAVGTLTGFDQPYGQCVDKTGDVFITNFGNGTAVEYARGGTSPITTYDTPGGEPIGCSVDAHGDVAVTNFDPGEVTVYPAGNPSDGTTYSSSSCEYLWTMGYDRHGNLVGAGENTRTAVCELALGESTMTTDSFTGTIYFPGGTMWDGKYIAVGDQEAGGVYQTGIYQSTLKGSTLTERADTVLSATCYNNYTDVVQPFIVGPKNTPLNKLQGKSVMGSNLWCADGSGSQVQCWNYPTGGGTVWSLVSPPAEPYGQAVSLPVHGALGVHRSIHPTCDSGV